MKVGDMVLLYDSRRRCGKYAGKLGLIVETGRYEDYVINVEGEIKKFHKTQIGALVNESR